MKIKKSILKSKVKSFTTNGEKAITRSYFYKEDGKDYTGISFNILYFSSSDTENDECVRHIGNKWVYKRTYSIKLPTILDTLINLGVIGGVLTNER